MSISGFFSDQRDMRKNSTRPPEGASHTDGRSDARGVGSPEYPTVPATLGRAASDQSSAPDLSQSIALAEAILQHARAC